MSNDVYGANQGASGYTLAPGYTISNTYGTTANVYSNGNQYVIAVRGTDTSNESNLAYHILSDSSFATGTPDTNLSAGVTQIANLLARIHANDPNAVITLTGHSLGGAIAQVVANAAGIAATTFDAPGAATLVPYFQSIPSIGSLADAHIPSPSHTIAAYRLYGDQVSLVGTQIASSVTTIANPIPLAGLPTAIVDDHSMSLLSNLLNSGATGSPGATGPDYVSSLVRGVANGALGNQLSYLINAVVPGVFSMIDPPAGATYSLVESPKATPRNYRCTFCCLGEMV